MTQPKQLSGGGDFPAQIPQILTPAEQAVLGAQMAQAGLEELEITALLGLIEQETQKAAAVAARQTALGVASAIMKLVRLTHDATCQRIYTKIQAQTSSMWGQSLHRNCLLTVQAEMNSLPRPREQ